MNSHNTAIPAESAKIDRLIEAQESDWRWFRDHKEALLTQYQGLFVAIQAGQLLASAQTPEQLLEAVSSQMRGDARLFIECVTPDAFEDRQPETIYSLT